MTESSPEAPARTCGACGAPVAANAVSCPTCGALLAAYESAGTSATADIGAVDTSATYDPAPTDTSATRDHGSAATSATRPPAAQGTPSRVSSPVPPAPVHRPTSQSPIGDALKRSRSDSAWYETPAETTLADLAAGDDDLAVMAAGDDDLAEMAAGDDELARMAGKDSTLAKEVDAEVTGAKVTFAGGASTIETIPAATPPPARMTAPTTKMTVPAATPRPGAAVADRPAPADRARRGVYQDPPIAWVETDQSGRVTNRPESGTSRPPAAKLPGSAIAIGAALMLCAVISIVSRSGAGLTLLMPLVIVGLVVWGLLRGAKATGRKTTTMPRDKGRR